jgi:hypothetical protein
MLLRTCTVPKSLILHNIDKKVGDPVMKSREGFCVLRILNPLVELQDMPEQEVQMRPDIPLVGLEGGRVNPEVMSAIKQARGGGKPLERPLQEQIGASLGHDFSEVRVHTGAEADDLNRQLSARAFTIGSDIFFTRGAYDPDSISGRELIAHELIHVVQQRCASGSDVMSGTTVSPAGDALEQEAQELASLVTAQPSWQNNDGATIRLRTKSPATIQRQLMNRCMTPPPHIVSCHATTMWWIYQEWEHRGGRIANWHTFIHLDQDVAELIASLIRVYGRKRTKWWTRGGIKVDRGSVVVFAGGRQRADVFNGHSCVCGNDSRLHGSSQGGCFDCNHGKVNVCDHAPNEINWTDMSTVDGKYNVYDVSEAQVMTWARTNL